MYSRKKYYVHDDLYYVIIIQALSTRNLITVTILNSEKANKIKLSEGN